MSISTTQPSGSTAYQQIEDFKHRDDRGGDIERNGLKSKTSEQATQTLTRSHKGFNDKNSDGTTRVTYSFVPASKKPQGEQGNYQGVSNIDEKQQTQTRDALNTWSDVTNLKFVEGPKDKDSEGHIAFGSFNKTKINKEFKPFAPHTIHPNASDPNAQIWTKPKDTEGPAGKAILIHEIGHAIGLDHPGNYGKEYREKKLGYKEDSKTHSIMSTYHHGNPPQTPMIDDIAAMQGKYGANYETRKDDTTYGFNSNANRAAFRLNSEKDTMRVAIWDGGGKDTLDFSGYKTDQKISLNEGTFSNVGGADRNVGIAYGAVIENATGGQGNDLILGNDVANELHGGAGDDVIAGGKGADTLWGGKGSDVFVYGNVSESSWPTDPDQIMDFESGKDKVDISGIRQELGLPLRQVEVQAGTLYAGEYSIAYDPKEDISTLRVRGKHAGESLMVHVHGRLQPGDIVT
jgi:serralysin